MPLKKKSSNLTITCHERCEVWMYDPTPTLSRTASGECSTQTTVSQAGTYVFEFLQHAPPATFQIATRTIIYTITGHSDTVATTTITATQTVVPGQNWTASVTRTCALPTIIDFQITVYKEIIQVISPFVVPNEIASQIPPPATWSERVQPFTTPPASRPWGSTSIASGLVSSGDPRPIEASSFASTDSSSTSYATGKALQSLPASSGIVDPVPTLASSASSSGSPSTVSTLTSHLVTKSSVSPATTSSTTSAGTPATSSTASSSASYSASSSSGMMTIVNLDSTLSGTDSTTTTTKTTTSVTATPSAFQMKIVDNVQMRHRRQAVLQRYVTFDSDNVGISTQDESSGTFFSWGSDGQITTDTGMLVGSESSAASSRLIRSLISPDGFKNWSLPSQTIHLQGAGAFCFISGEIYVMLSTASCEESIDLVQADPSQATTSSTLITVSMSNATSSVTTISSNTTSASTTGKSASTFTTSTHFTTVDGSTIESTTTGITVSSENATTATSTSTINPPSQSTTTTADNSTSTASKGTTTSSHKMTARASDSTTTTSQSTITNSTIAINTTTTTAIPSTTTSVPTSTTTTTTISSTTVGPTTTSATSIFTTTTTTTDITSTTTDSTTTTISSIPPFTNSTTTTGTITSTTNSTTTTTDSATTSTTTTTGSTTTPTSNSACIEVSTTSTSGYTYTF
ncbi:hypothetical protein EDD36DRAFT_480825 [Exophiala viscosa]|uniref:REJ domain-containing protein n=1 Tax=Exophiala viscosa TaxID=2486360 RepID=A0AAN6E7C9_9EURO|nr:hypothetical protein EDD36DRAFT_480825 [Exophiala viscosa]